MGYNDPRYADPEYFQHYRDKNRERIRERSRKYARQRREWLNALKDKPCADCGESYDPIVMDFHHRDGTDKDFGVAASIKTVARERVLREIEKCDLLCANCHRLRHKAQPVPGQQ